MCLSFIRVTNRNSVEPYNLYAPYSSCLARTVKAVQAWPFEEWNFLSIQSPPRAAAHSCIDITTHLLPRSLPRCSLPLCRPPSLPHIIAHSFPHSLSLSPTTQLSAFAKITWHLKNWTHIRPMDSKESCNKFYKQLREFKKKSKLRSKVLRSVSKWFGMQKWKSYSLQEKAYI